MYLSFVCDILNLKVSVSQTMTVYSAHVGLFLPSSSTQSTAIMFLENRDYPVGSRRVIAPIHGRLNTKTDLKTTLQIPFCTIYLWQSAPTLFNFLQHHQEVHCQYYRAQEMPARPARLRQLMLPTSMGDSLRAGRVHFLMVDLDSQHTLCLHWSPWASFCSVISPCPCLSPSSFSYHL